MKQLLSTLIMLLLLATAVQAAETSSQRPVDISLQSYQPTPAQPGDLLDVFIQVTNSGLDEVEDVQIELLQTDAFVPQGQTLIDAGTIAAQTSFNARFKVKVRIDAPAGDNLLLVRTSQPKQSPQERTVEIVIQDDVSALVVDQVVVEPQVATPGEQAEVTFDLRNTGNTQLRDVNIELDLDDTPFIPTTGTTRQQVTALGGQGIKSVSYVLGVKPTATADLYKVPVTVTFLDEQGTTQTQTDDIGIRVNTRSDTRAFIDQLTATETDYQVAIRVVNKGLSEIKFVEATIGKGEGYEIPVQEREVYVGNIDTDDWETIRFTLESDAEKIMLPLQYTYQDAFNQQHVVTQEFTIDLPDKPEKKNNAFVPIVLIIVLGLVIWYFTRRKRKR